MFVVRNCGQLCCCKSLVRTMGANGFGVGEILALCVFCCADCSYCFVVPTVHIVLLC